MSVVNHEYRHAFIHIARCAGGSMEQLPWVGGNGHERISTILPRLPPDYRTWAFVRNPYDRLVSTWCAFHQGAAHEVTDVTRHDTFGDWVRHLHANPWELNHHAHTLPQHLYVYIVSKRCVKFIGRVEALHRDWERLCRWIGVPVSPLRQENASAHAQWEHWYDSETLGMVSRLYEADFALLGYDTVC